jgi:hypothetical protein
MTRREQDFLVKIKFKISLTLSYVFDLAHNPIGFTRNQANITQQEGEGERQLHYQQNPSDLSICIASIDSSSRVASILDTDLQHLSKTTINNDINMCRQSISSLLLALVVVAGFTATTGSAFVLPSTTTTRTLAFVVQQQPRQPLVCLALTEAAEAEAAAEPAAAAPAAVETQGDAATSASTSTEAKEPKRILTRERFTIFAGNLPFGKASTHIVLSTGSVDIFA